MADWSAIKFEYTTTTISYRALAEKYGVHKDTIGRKAKAEGWPKLRRQQSDKVSTRALKADADKKVKKATRVQMAADKLLTRIEAMADRDDMEARDLKALVSALKDIKDIKGERSALDLKEQEARIKALEQKGTNTASSVTVEIGEANEYAQ